MIKAHSLLSEFAILSKIDLQGFVDFNGSYDPVDALCSYVRHPYGSLMSDERQMDLFSSDTSSFRQAMRTLVTGYLGCDHSAGKDGRPGRIFIHDEVIQLISDLVALALLEAL
jgi:hypothetical protein